MLYDASCRDGKNPERWLKTSITIREFSKLREQGLPIPGWGEYIYNEHLIKGSVPPEKIVAYAKIEAKLPREEDIEDEHLTQIQNFVSHELGFATQFSNPADNILIDDKPFNPADYLSSKDYKFSTDYIFRVALNREKAFDRENEVTSFFTQFSSMSELIIKAQNFSDKTTTTLPTCLPSDHHKHPDYKEGGSDKSPHLK